MIYYPHSIELNSILADITFSDILISPSYSEITSRSEVSTCTELDKIQLSLPVISANMKTVTGSKMATVMSENGGLGIIHRFCSIEDNVLLFQDAIHHLTCNVSEWPYKVGVSVGVQEEDKKRFDCLYMAGAKLFCIDVAHGHHIFMKNMISWIRDNYPEDVCIIAGNVATGNGAEDLKKWGANIIKVGIGPGRGCTTRKNTGVGVPQISALMECRRAVGNKFPIISDGGITCSGDVSKALIFANAVMVGSYVAGTSESPGHVFRGEDDVLYKVYGGSASGESKTSNGQDKKFVEGITITVPFRGKVKYILKEIREGIQSALSYTGVNNLKDFRQKSSFRIISGGSSKESKY